MDARVSHGVATTGEGCSSSSRWDRATLSVRNSFIATNAPAWTFATSFAGMGGNEGANIIDDEAGVVLRPREGSVRSGRSVATGMWGIGTVVLGVVVMGIAWTIAASGGIPPRCEPEVWGRDGTGMSAELVEWVPDIEGWSA